MSQELNDSIPEYDFSCRNSDYRMVQSDPTFNVVDVKADASAKGNIMLTAVTAWHTSAYYKITNISVLSGAECYVRDDIQIVHDDVLDVKIGETWKVGYKSPIDGFIHTWDYTLHILIQEYAWQSQV